MGSWTLNIYSIKSERPITLSLRQIYPVVRKEMDTQELACTDRQEQLQCTLLHKKRNLFFIITDLKLYSFFPPLPGHLAETV